jgi:hypothetical protein
MLRSLLRGRVSAFERTWRYDASYLRELIDAGPTVVMRFGLVGSLGHLRGAPPAALAAARLVGTLSEDCGPCTQLGVDMASREGVSPEVLRALVTGDEAQMGEDAALAYRFARASLRRDLAVADPLREQIRARWGRRGLVAIALALTTARMYPTLKYALGHGHACSRVQVPGLAAVAPGAALSAPSHPV